jgi:hypothetical protein
MAISDFFSGGNTPDYLSGLLDDEQLRRLKQNAQQNALMQFGLSALAQGGYSQTPVGIGEILGKSGMAGMQGYQQGIQSGIEGIGTRAKLEEMQRKKQEDAQRKAYMQQYAATLPAEQQAAIQAMPELGAELAKNQFMPKKPVFEKVGNQLIDVTSGTPTVAFTGQAEAGQTPSAIQEYNFAVGQGYKGSFENWKNAQKPAGTTINMGQEKAESKAVGEYFGKQYSEIQSAGYLASNKLNKVSRLNNLLEGVNTGKLTPAGVEIASTAQSLGFTVDPKLGNKQAAEALTNEMALELRNPSGGAGMPGAMSDADRQFLRGMVPGIEKTPEGRKMITESMVKLAKRDQEVAKIARDYRKKKGMIDEGFYEELNAYSAANPLFPAQSSGGWSIKKVR